MRSAVPLAILAVYFYSQEEMHQGQRVQELDSLVAGVPWVGRRISRRTLHSGLEHQSYPGVVESLKVSTRANAERIRRFAFDFALKDHRKVRKCANLACQGVFLIAISTAPGRSPDAWLCLTCTVRSSRTLVWPSLVVPASFPVATVDR